MNRAMHDLLAATLDGWYGYLSSWQAPGAEGRLVCELCHDSPFSRVADLTEWPHDVAHALVRDLTSAVRHVRITLEELDESNAFSAARHVAVAPFDVTARREVLGSHAESLVLAGIAVHEPLMRDVLEQCVAPRLEAYLRAEADRAILAFSGFDESGRRGILD